MTNRLEFAERTVLSMTTALDHLSAQLAARCSSAGRLDGRVDEWQVPLFELALASAVVAADRSLLRHAQRYDDALLTALAVFHHRDTVQQTNQHLHTIAQALDLPRVHIEEPTGQWPSQRELTVTAMQQLRERSGALGPDPVDAEKRLMRETFRQFANKVVAPRAAAIHRENLTLPRAIVDGLRGLGCFGLCVPEAYGGLRPNDRDDSLLMLIATEELSRASLGAAGSLITRPEIFARALLEGGTAEQKQRWLPALAKADPLCAVSFTEPNTGSDVASVALRATRTDGGWLLNGAKSWCTMAGLAGVIMVIARTDPTVRPLHRGLSLFMVEKPPTEAHEFNHSDGRSGSMSGYAVPTLGYRGMHSFEMFYDNWFVPDSHLIGGDAGLGKGFYWTMAGFSGGRLQTAARATGLMRAAFDAALQYAEQRVVFGKAVVDYSLTEHKLVRMAAHVVASRQLSYDVAARMDEGGGQMDASLVKLFACRAAEWVTREALQIHGGMGYAEESSVSRYWVDARVLSIFEGAEETLALRVIGKDLLERTLQRSR